MRDTLKGFVIGALVAAAATVLLAQTPNWTAPRSWSTGDLLTAGQFNAQLPGQPAQPAGERGMC